MRPVNTTTETVCQGNFQNTVNYLHIAKSLQYFVKVQTTELSTKGNSWINPAVSMKLRKMLKIQCKKLYIIRDNNIYI